MFLSFLKIMFPNCRTEETTFNIPAGDKITGYSSPGRGGGAGNGRVIEEKESLESDE